ncbi:uncharacterized protein [Rutidosis leptorrhynchoides]|uniref:uncharacterized protein n=1 Tax=Rutidosis leptorrhynchoides TaxID=125765 RepID=UPI003A9A42FE
MSFGGRLTLLKSVLSSLRLYYFSLYSVPPSVLKLLESVRRIFFWGGDLSGTKISWVKWENILLPYESGGLNVGSLKNKNLALLGKWWWRFKTDTTSLWTKLIRSIYGIDSGLRSVDGLAHLPILGTWKDIWCDTSSFKDLFPRLFRLDRNIEVLGNSIVLPKKTLHNNLIPKKVEILVWKTRKKRLRVELDKRGVDLYSTRCPVCDEDLESVEHLFVSCKFSKDVWSRIFKWWNFNLPQNLVFSDLFLGKSTSTMSTLGTKIWQSVEWICAYYIWKNRNMMVFQNKGWIPPVVISEIQVKSFEWVSNRIKDKTIDWHVWLTNPSLICT